MSGRQRTGVRRGRGDKVADCALRQDFASLAELIAAVNGGGRLPPVAPPVQLKRWLGPAGRARRAGWFVAAECALWVAMICFGVFLASPWFP